MSAPVSEAENWRKLARTALAHLRRARNAAPGGYRESLSHQVASLELMTKGVEADLDLDPAGAVAAAARLADAEMDEMAVWGEP